MPSKLVRSISAIVVVAATVFATSGSAENRAMVLPVDPVPLVAETAGGPSKFSIEVADDVNERSLGLMFREDLPADRGMLFVFEETRPVGFWMKNTPLPLDLIFIGDDGKVKAIRQGEPLSEAVIAPNDAVRFVLELNAGTASARKIETGDQMRHPQIDAVGGAFADSPG
jgi:uncharacterized membrane protein (UPF0127 family)